jgi:hypothetical protein
MSATMAQSLPTFPRPPVFLSASVPLIDRDPLYYNSADPIAIRDAVVALATAVLPATGIVFGGHPAITPLISAVASRLSGTVIGRVILFQSGWFVTSIPPHPMIEGVITPREATRADSLRTMRIAMLTSYPQFTAGVFIGGMEGVRDEFLQFRQFQPSAMLLPVASTGAAAALITVQELPPPGGWPPELRNDTRYLSVFRRLLGM